MLDYSGFVFIPFIVAFLMFVAKFYAHENVASLGNPTFLLACLAAVLPILFLSLHTMGVVIPYGAVVIGGIGLVMALWSVVRFMRY
jgi:hypothetical protein